MKSFLFLLFALVASAEEADVVLRWDAPVDPDVVAYRLKIGTEPGVYPMVIELPAVPAWSGRLPVGLYFGIVAAVNTSGVESEPSPPLAFQAAQPGAAMAPAAPVGLAQVQPVEVTLEWSGDLVSWTQVSSQVYFSPGIFMFWRVKLVLK